ncbi:MAG: sugar isomerase domain-containing protein [Firmicutes bacterium]|jgi:uncharacterized phosphosugar-binding protein|nr:sugar isomerase domain-containing protein [Bacillota bacterium]
MLGEKYLEAVREVLSRIGETQKQSLARAAELAAEAIAKGGAIHLLDTGHLLMHEMFGRVGGLMLLRPVQLTLEVENPGPKRRGRSKPKVYLDEIPGLPQFVLDRSEIYPGDVLIIGSVSGKNVLPVGVALLAREQGVKVIALTSVEYSRFLEPRHPSGKRLFEVADVVLDNCGVVGDATLEVPGMEAKICPTSGIAAACLMWMLEAEIVEALLARGMKPHVYLSNHMPGAGEFNRRALEEYESQGY